MKFADLLQSADWKTEKHVPVIDAPLQVTAGKAFTARVSVGKEIAHPNTTEHHIRWIRLYFKPDGGKFAYELAQSDFAAHGEAIEGPNKGPAYTDPVMEVTLRLNVSGTLVAASYCNIHGLWESSHSIEAEA